MSPTEFPRDIESPMMKLAEQTNNKEVNSHSF